MITVFRAIILFLWICWVFAFCLVSCTEFSVFCVFWRNMWWWWWW